MFFLTFRMVERKESSGGGSCTNCACAGIATRTHNSAARLLIFPTQQVENIYLRPAIRCHSSSSAHIFFKISRAAAPPLFDVRCRSGARHPREGAIGNPNE